MKKFLFTLCALSALTASSASIAHDRYRGHHEWRGHQYHDPYRHNRRQYYGGGGYYVVPQPPVQQWLYCDPYTQGVLQCGPNGCYCVKWW
ncbi:MAG: hypothetical protein RLZZ342_328 [Candidatus Parcubacteria bacterium]|jgi:hypothetical protein